MEVMKRGFGAERETEKKKKFTDFWLASRAMEPAGTPRSTGAQKLWVVQGYGCSSSSTGQGGVGLHMTWRGRAPEAKTWSGKGDCCRPGVPAVVPLLALVELSMLPALGSHESPVVFTDKHTHGN